MAAFEAGGGQPQHSALAKKIRAAVEQETFDLGGMTESQVTGVLTSAFTEPFEQLPGMIRLSFVVGGGKGVRTRYDDSMPRWCSQALKAIGFEEDKSASCDLASRRRFKFHHDTGKNLKMIVVFPDVSEETATAAQQQQHDEEEGGEHQEGGGRQQVVVNAVEVCLECPLEVFGAMVAAMAPSWSQRQRLVKDVLLPRCEQMDAIEAKMMGGVKLEDDEQKAYELLSGASLKEKVEVLTASMKTLVDEGSLTTQDLDKLKTQVEGKLEALKDEETKGTIPAKKAEAQRKALDERKAKLAAVSPIVHPLKRQSELKPLWRKQLALQQEKAATTKGRLLTLLELRKYSEIDRLEESIVALVEESRTFFETDQELQDRAQVARKKSVAGMAAPAKKKPATTGAAAAKGGGWSSVGAKKPARSSAGGGGSKGAGANAFAALGGDSDSD